MKRLPGLVYRSGSDSRNSGDLFLPDAGESGRILMLIHGGGWQALDRHSIRGAAHEIARLCRVAVWAPDYRLIGMAPWPACLEDVEAAARWIMATREVPLAPPQTRKLAVGGFSAGGHLALMVGLTRMRREADCILAIGAPSVIAKGLYSHARDIFSREFFRKFFGRSPGSDDYRKASPVARIGKAPLPPLLIVHNTADHLVPPFHARALVARYRRRGGDCRTCLFAGKPPSHDIMIAGRTSKLSERHLRHGVRDSIQAFLSGKFR